MGNAELPLCELHHSNHHHLPFPVPLPCPTQESHLVQFLCVACCVADWLVGWLALADRQKTRERHFLTILTTSEVSYTQHTTTITIIIPLNIRDSHTECRRAETSTIQLQLVIGEKIRITVNINAVDRYRRWRDVTQRSFSIKYI